MSPRPPSASSCTTPPRSEFEREADEGRVPSSSRGDGLGHSRGANAPRTPQIEEYDVSWQS